MRLQYVASACVVVEHSGVHVLCDPWLVDGAYGGAWYHNPPLKVKPEDFHDVPFIYLSHIHPDHADFATLERLSRESVILLARFDEALRKPLALRLQKMGFTVVELPHDSRYALADGFTIQVIPADDCNPEACGQFFGCAMHAAPGTTAQVDSLAVFHVAGQTIVNVNDVPFGLAHAALDRVVESYPEIDLLCVGYAGAGPYPQCFTNLSDEQKRAAGKAKRNQFLDQMRAFVNYLDPAKFLPFAGQYTLGGSLVDLNDFRGVPELDDLDRWPDERMVRLNRMAWLDCATGESSEEWRRDDPVRRATYRELLRHKPLDHEADPWPSTDELRDLTCAAEGAWHSRLKKQNITVNTAVGFTIGGREGQGPLAMWWLGHDVDVTRHNEPVPTLTIFVDARLLVRILTRKFNFNNAEVGSLLRFQRTPDTYDRALFHALAFLHV